MLKVTIEVFDGATTQVRQAFTDYNLSKALTTNVTMMPLIYQKIKFKFLLFTQSIHIYSMGINNKQEKLGEINGQRTK